MDLTRIGAARDAARRAFIAACRHAVDEGEALGDSELVHTAHDAMDRIIPGTTSASDIAPLTASVEPANAHPVAEKARRLCPVSGRAPEVGEIFVGWGTDAKAKAVVNCLLADGPLIERGLVVAATWHDPSAAERVALLARAAGLTRVSKVEPFFREDAFK